MEAVSLLASLPGLFQSCIHGYRVVSTILALDKDLEVLRIRYRIEETRFALWGRCWGWSEKGPTVKVEHPESDLDGILQLPGIQQLMEEILKKIEMLLRQLQEIFKRYASEVQGTSGDNGKNNMQMTPNSAPSAPQPSTLRRLRGLPAKLRWAIEDKSTFKEILDSLVSLNSGLDSLLPRSEKRRLENALPSEVLAQEGNAVAAGNRKRIIAAIEVPAVQADSPPAETMLGNEDDGASIHSQHAEKHPQTPSSEPYSMKLRLEWFRDLDSDRSGRTLETLTIPSNNFRFRTELPEPNGGNDSTSGKESTCGPKNGSEDQLVLVEWKGYKDTIDSEQLQMALDARKDQISQHLFQPNNTEAYHYVLPCLGYVILTEEVMGLVFTLPPGCDRLPRTLNNILETDFESIAATSPSLETRISLARKISSALYQLECAGWLHRQISSHNILFFYTPSGPSEVATVLDLSQPYLAGWQSSRHDDRKYQEVSTGIHSWRKYPYLWIEYPYMHPLRPRTRFRRSYDIYSLGVVLAEIAFWEPIGALKGIKSNDTEAWKKISEDLSSWSENVYLTCEKELGAEVGEKYRSAVLWCLRGFQQWQAQEFACASGDDTEEKIFEREVGLEKGFFWNVVNVLEEIKC